MARGRAHSKAARRVRAARSDLRHGSGRKADLQCDSYRRYGFLARTESRPAPLLSAHVALRARRGRPPRRAWPSRRVYVGAETSDRSVQGVPHYPNNRTLTGNWIDWLTGSD